jgi:hypothetical protein
MNRAAAVAVVFTLVLGAAPSASAITITATPATASVSVTLNGDDQVPTFANRMTLTTTGNAGWSLYAYAPAPSGTKGTLSALTVTAEPVPSCGSGTCTVSVANASITGIAWPLTLGTSSGTAAKFWNAIAGSGNNKNQFVDVVFGVPVPSGAIVGTYTTTLTVSVQIGP